MTFNLAILAPEGLVCAQRLHTVMHPAAVWKRYLSSWFIVDLCMVSFDWATVSASGPKHRLESVFRSLKGLKTLRLLRGLKMSATMLCLWKQGDIRHCFSRSIATSILVISRIF